MCFSMHCFVFLYLHNTYIVNICVCMLIDLYYLCVTNIYVPVMQFMNALLFVHMFHKLKSHLSVNKLPLHSFLYVSNDTENTMGHC